ncbi:hypothetical protein [Methylomarinum vadi]|uniref:hypothetical protein n=1 Tax=Methylomarinum vadi TaxID=438855 RepID=UPI0012684611|nr:hypothetical protein [Methylomarinum vadi]
MNRNRTPGPEGLTTHSTIPDGTLSRAATPPPGPLGAQKGSSSKEQATPTPSFTTPNCTVVFVTTGDTRPHPYPEFRTYDEFHEFQAYDRYDTTHVYMPHSAGEAQRTLERLTAQGHQICRVVFLGHGSPDGFIFRAEVEGGRIVPYRNERRSVYTESDTGLTRALRGRVQFHACFVGQNQALIRSIGDVVGEGNVDAPEGRYVGSVTRRRDAETGDTEFVWEE